MRTNTKHWAYRLALVGFLLSTGTHAQNETTNSDEQESTNELDQVTVIGHLAIKDAEIGGTNIKELPINSHVVNRPELERLRFVDPDEFLDRIPGETQVRNLRIPNGGKSYTIPLLDGLPLESPYEGATQRLDRVNTGDIERIEIIKGPASAIYPSNAFGGVINVISRDAPEDSEAKVWSEFGSFGRQRLGFNMGGTSDRLGYFIDANTRNLDGERDEARNDRDQFSGKLSFQVTETAKLTARLEHLDENMVARGDLNREEIIDDPTQAGSIDSATDLQQNTASLKWEQLIGNADIDFSLVRREKDTIGLSRFRGPQDENDAATSSKLIYRYDFDRSNLILGFDTYAGKQLTDQYEREDVTLSGPATQFSNKLDIQAYFIQYQISPIERFTVTAGLRHENIELSSSLFPQAVDFNDTSLAFMHLI